MVFSFAILLLSLGFIFVAWKDVKMAAVLLLALLPTYLIRFSIGPFPSTFLEVMVLAVIVASTIKYKLWRMDFLRTAGIYRSPLLLLIAALCFSLAASQDLWSALGIARAFFLEPFALFFVFRAIFEKREDWTLALKALSVSAIVIGVFAVVSAVTGYGIPVPWDVEGRATSVFDFPNAVGLFLAPIVSAAVVMAFDACNRKDRKALIAFAIVAVLGIFGSAASRTEAAFVAIPAVLFITLLVSKTNLKKKIVASGIVALLAVIAIAVVPVVRQKLLLQDYSGQVRITTWKETIELLKHHPLTGAGLHGYPAAMLSYHNASEYEIFQYPHNILLNFWVELGIVGVIALFVFAYAVSRAVGSAQGDFLVLAAFAALLTMAIHGLVDVPFFKNDLAILAVFFLSLTIYRRVEKVESVEM